MSATRRAPQRQRGICINNTLPCPKAVSKEEQEPRGDFICVVCGRRLVPAPVPWWKGKVKPILAAAAVVVVALIGSWIYALTGGPELLRRVPATLPGCTSDNPGSNAQNLHAIVERNLPAEQALAAARQCLALNNAPDALLLLRPLADRGNAEAAFLTGEIYDPVDLNPTRAGQMRPPVPNNAAAAYIRASCLGYPEANARLARLNEWAEQQVNEGNASAREVVILLDTHHC